jgi:hypothetical protein
MVKQNFSLSEAKNLASSGVLANKPKPQIQPPKYTEGFGSATMDRKWLNFDDTKFYEKDDIWEFIGLNPFERKLLKIGGKKMHCKKCNHPAKTLKKIAYCKTCGSNYAEMPKGNQCQRCGSKVAAGTIYGCTKCKTVSAPGYEKMSDGKEVRVADVMGRDEALTEFFDDSLIGYKTIYTNAALAIACFGLTIFTFVALSPWIAGVFALLTGRFYQMWQTSNYFAIQYNKCRPLISTI